MYRSSLRKDKIGLFIFPQQKHVSFWMKNTYVSLDLIYLDKNGKVVDVFKSLDPLSEREYLSSKKVSYAIEANVGFIDNLEIEIGDFLEEILDFK